MSEAVEGLGVGHGGGRVEVVHSRGNRGQWKPRATGVIRLLEFEDLARDFPFDPDIC